MSLRSAAPKVTLTKTFETPYDNAVATARTCYSSRVISDDDVRKKPKLRDRIAASIYTAGHHTTLQHAHFQFSFENVSRQVLWSFFHAHPFYNSEQVSQRYVEVRAGHVIQPELGDDALNARYDQVVERQMALYRELLEALLPAAQAAYFETFPARRKRGDDKRWVSAIKKRCQEVARYVLPVGTFAHLYHTVSGLTLHRYRRLSALWGCPEEQREIIEAMCAEVAKIDENFFAQLKDPIPLEDTLEARLFQQMQHDAARAQHAKAFNAEFDDALAGQTSKMVRATDRAEEVLADGVRCALGVPTSALSDDDAIAAVLDPRQNPYLSDALNLSSLGKATRAMELCHFTFKKRISHSADSQAQRHRMTPGVRPNLADTIVPGEPDYVTPKLLLRPEAEAALRMYRDEMTTLWNDIAFFADADVSREQWQYLLPNATVIRYVETGPLIHQHHKWTTRLCFTAQEEIWSAIVDEVRDVRERFPKIGAWLLPPCGLRHVAKAGPKCPEGDRYCGVRVWTQDINTYERRL